MAATLTHLSDFPDRLSPMLVKELRQGMRARIFIVLFLVIQLFLAVTLLGTSLSRNAENAGPVISTVIFVLFSAAALVIQPLRGIAALASEVKGNTIDMMVLTRLSAWRIVTGKWVALVSQTALLFTTIIPYLILRYFFGGMALMEELVALALIFIVSMALTAVTVGLSGCNSVIIRALVPLIGLPTLVGSLVIQLAIAAVRGALFTGTFGIGATEGWIGIGFLVAAATYLAASMLSLGASLIAPPAENHARTRRLVAFALLLVACGIGPTDWAERLSIDEFIGVFAAVVAIPAVILAFTDSAPLVSTVCEPFVKRGGPGRIVGCFLYPTWSSGALAGLVLLALAVVACGAAWGDLDPESLVGLLAAAGSLLFPATLLACLRKPSRQRLTPYLLVLVLSGLAASFFAIIAETTDSSAFLWIFAFHPLAYPAMEGNGGVSLNLTLGGVTVCNLVLAAILLKFAIADLRRARPVLQQAARNLGVAS